jgi:hypothetical protein
MKPLCEIGVRQSPVGIEGDAREYREKRVEGLYRIAINYFLVRVGQSVANCPKREMVDGISQRLHRRGLRKVRSTWLTRRMGEFQY